VERARQQPRWQVVSRAGVARLTEDFIPADDLLISLSIPSATPNDSIPRAALATAEARALYAVLLGEAADRLAQRDPLPAPQEVAGVLERIPPPGVLELSVRRIRLAAACARQAALSSRLEFYPDGLPAARALKLAAGSLIGLRQFDLETLKRRIFVRYPKAAALPAPGELEGLLREAGLNVRWDHGQRVFISRFPDHIGSGTSQSVSTTTGARQRLATAPAVEAALRLEQRIKQALTAGKLLTLSVNLKDYLRAQYELSARFSLPVVDFDAVILRHLQAQAEEWEVDWGVLLAADAAPPGSVDAQNFATVLHEVWPKIEAELLASNQPELLVNVGLAARWRRMALFAKLADACLHRQRPPLIVLIASPLTPDNRPMLDHEAVPVAINTTDYGYIPLSWLEKAHCAV
jgi:hypothetical protein